MSRKWTIDQQNAIEARGGSLLVSAAAGSGKTAVLVERVIRRILDDNPPTDIDRLLVVTFSKASAAEMRDRIGMRIRERLKTDPSNSHLIRQQMLLETAHISTIHSFCYDLIRQNFAQLGLSHDVRLGDDQEMKLLRQGALQRVLTKRYAQGNEGGFLELVELVSGSRSDREMENLVESLYAFLRSHPFYDEWLEEKKSAYDASVPVESSDWGRVIIDYARDGVDYAIVQLIQALSLMDSVMDEAYGDVFREDLKKMQYLSEVCAEGNWDEIYVLLHNISFDSLKALKGYENQSLKNFVQDCRKQVKDLIEELRDKRFCCTAAQYKEDIAFLAPRISVLFDTVMDLDIEYGKAKRERRILDFSDLEHLALQLLVNRTDGKIEKTELAQQLSLQLDEIFVDEYQDTNSVQEMLFTTLSRNEENLFFVGDVKQSIYRFRQAMPELFIGRKEKSCDYNAVDYPSCIRLGKNFRSRPAVTDTVNYLFRMLMSKKVGEIEYNEEEELVCSASYPEDSENSFITEIRLLKTDKTQEDPKKTEAKYVAAYIRSLLQSGMLVGAEDRHPIRPEDICILLRSHKGRSTDYIEALAEYRIPGWASVEEGFLDSEEISSVLALLQAVDNPLLNMALTQAIMSPVFAMSADDVARIRAFDKYGPMYHAVLKAAEAGDSGCSRFLAVLDDLRRHAAWESADRVIQRLYDITGFERVVQVMPGGRLRCDNLRLLVDYAAGYEQRGFRGLSGFLTFINRLKQQGGDLAPASAAAGGAVTVRSIHSSKGLEYPVVILADMEKQMNRQDVRKNTQIHSTLGFACKRRDNQKLIQYTTVPLEATRIEAEREQLSEELRVLYVALTRAKEKLVLVAASEDPIKKVGQRNVSITNGAIAPWAVRHASSYLDWVISALLWHCDGEDLVCKAGLIMPQAMGKAGLFKVILAEKTEQTQQREADVLQFASPDPKLVEQLEANAAYCYPFAQDCLSPSKFAVSQLTHRQEEEYFCTVRPAFMNEQGMTSAQKGSATHKFMEYADYSAAATSFEEELQRLVDRKFLSAQEADVVDRKSIELFFASKLYKRMDSAERVLRELRFMGELTAKELSSYTDLVKGEEPVVLKGVADCVLLEKDGAVIIDYKTDHVKSADQLLQRYCGQLELYSRLVSAYLGCSVKECWIYSFALGEALRVC
ncbi:MAG: helicase-exonuclease AddAB subunit AddA [Oscillospiraceae bacterium]|nr:helicase-exonuclease AddAB subunit AddA [Oscillospiraceae bacterium]